MKKILFTAVMSTLLLIACRKQGRHQELPSETLQYAEKSLNCHVIGEYSTDLHRMSLLSDTAVIFINFNGRFVPAGTYWDNYNLVDTVTCQPYPLTQEQKDRIVVMVRDDFSPVNIIVTTEQSVFDAAPGDGRVEAVVTSTTSVYNSDNSIKGVACGNSFTLSGNPLPSPGFWTPGCFIFPGRIDAGFGGIPFEEQIARIVSHEVGHTMNAQHCGTWVGGSMNWYLGGGWTVPSKVGHISIMSTSPNIPDKICTWWIGGDLTSNPNNNVNPLGNFGAYCGWAADEASSDFSAPKEFSVSLVNIGPVGVLGQNDVDVWKYKRNKLQVPATIYVSVQSLFASNTLFSFSMGGIDTTYSNVDFLVETYNASQVLQAIYDPAENAQVRNIMLQDGWYLKIRATDDNPYVDPVNMTGQYIIVR
jgi:hypothetical protein